MTVILSVTMGLQHLYPPHPHDIFYSALRNA